MFLESSVPRLGTHPCVMESTDMHYIVSRGGSPLTKDKVYSYFGAYLLVRLRLLFFCQMLCHMSMITIFIIYLWKPFCTFLSALNTVRFYLYFYVTKLNQSINLPFSARSVTVPAGLGVSVAAGVCFPDPGGPVAVHTAFETPSQTAVAANPAQSSTSMARLQGAE